MNALTRAEHMGVTPVCKSEAVSLRDGADKLAFLIHMMVHECHESYIPSSIIFYHFLPILPALSALFYPFR